MSQLRQLPALGLFCALLLFVQGASLIHTHQGELQLQTDCEICLKVGSFDDIMPASKVLPDTRALLRVFDSPVISLVTLSPPPRQARAPPVLS